MVSAVKEKRILVVDDDETIRGLCSDVLSSAGYRVDTAGDAIEGLDMIRRSGYAMVLSDIDMPGLNGLSFYYSALRECAWLKERFLFISGRVTKEVQEVLSELNVVWLAKPFKVSMLLEKVGELTGRAQKGPGSPGQKAGDG